MKQFIREGHPVGQPWLIPPSIDEFVPEGSPVRLLSEIIDSLDLTHLRRMNGGAGPPSYDPVALLKAYVFGMMQGVRSSRQLEAALENDLRYKFLAEMATPDFRTLARFRRDHLKELAEIFVSTVKVGKAMGAVKGDRVAVDGTKVIANAAKGSCRSKEQLQEALGKAEAEAKEILAKMDANDQDDDKDDPDGRSGQLPSELQSAKDRAAKLTELMDRLNETGSSLIVETDPDSRVNKTNSGLRPAYNCQAVADAASQVVVAADVCPEEADNQQLRPMMEQAIQNLGQQPAEALADGGYWSEDSLAYAEEHALNAYIAPTGLTKKQAERQMKFTYDAATDTYIAPSGDVYRYERRVWRDRRFRYRVYGCDTTREKLWIRVGVATYLEMRKKTRTPEGKLIYSQRKTIIEPVFGHIKTHFRLDRLLLRGLDGARIEFLLACIAHNLGKLMRHAMASSPAA